MAIDIGKFSSSSLDLYQLRRDKVSSEKSANTQKAAQEGAVNSDETQNIADDSPAAAVQRFGDSIDEMSILLSQFRNRRDYEKKIGSASESSFEQILDEDVLPKVYALLKVTSSVDGSNIKNLLQQVRSLFPDDSDLVLVLRELLRRRNIDEVVRRRLKIMLQQVEKQANPRRLKAGINVAFKARLFGKALQLDPALMRESYRDFLESDAHEVEVYQDWISTYGAKHRAAVVDFMESSLLSDMDAQDPSCSHIEFGNLLGRLGQVKLIRSSDSAFIDNVLKNALIRAHNDSEQAWLLFMLCVLQHPEHIKDYLQEAIGERIKLSKHAERSSLLHIISQACKNLPRELFYEPEDADVLAREFERLATIAYRYELIELRRGNLE
ncbi:MULTISPECIES: type III secretion system gatekeeper subunit SctW [Yersinia]|uniref:type III secretion system gatekeeper subunit SctW n=1 Tax=Yersinia TaxID=629 RepID=UPI000A044CA0|nr:MULTISPECIES: type III secretion system gatekeeper subunit SctW [Yersinia]